MLFSCLALLWALPAPAQVAPTQGPRVQLEALDGGVRELPLDGWAVAEPRELGAVFVRFVGLPAPSPLRGREADRVTVRLASGDTLRGRIRDGEGDRFELEIVGGASFELSIDEFVSLSFPQRLPSDGSAILSAAPEGDRLYRTSGKGVDRVDGLVQGFDSAGVSFESRLGERLYLWEEVAALFVENLGEVAAGEDEREGLPVVVDLRGDSRLRGRLVHLDANGCRLSTPSNPSLMLPAPVIGEIAVDDGSYRFVSELPVADAGPVSPFGDHLGMTWPHRMDRSCMGDPLRAGGRVWSRGIGVHAPSRLTFELDGTFRELRCAIAVDENRSRSELRLGSVVFRVLVDGEERFTSPVVRGGDAPVEIAVPVEGGRQLVLQVDESEDAHIFDRADWLRPILVR